MDEGPGLRQRARETKAVQNSVDPEIDKAPPAAPPQEVDKINPKAKFGSKKGEIRLPFDQWMKPLASYKDGTDFVPKTGVYKLHEGERVTPAIIGGTNNNLRSYKDGTDYVPKTGPAILHEGEKVTPAKDNMADVFDKVPGRKSEEKPKKSIKRIEITKSHNGRHIVKHVHHHPAHEDETHVMNDMAALHSHLEDHAGTPNEGEGPESSPAGAPAQLAASAPAPGAEPTAVPGA